MPQNGALSGYTDSQRLLILVGSDGKLCAVSLPPNWGGPEGLGARRGLEWGQGWFMCAKVESSALSRLRSLVLLDESSFFVCFKGIIDILLL